MTAVTRQPLRPVCASKWRQEVATTAITCRQNHKQHLLSFQNQFICTWTPSLVLHLYVNHQYVYQTLHLPQTWDIIQINKRESPRLSLSLSLHLSLFLSLSHTLAHKLTVVFGPLWMGCNYFLDNQATPDLSSL